MARLIKFVLLAIVLVTIQACARTPKAPQIFNEHDVDGMYYPIYPNTDDTEINYRVNVGTCPIHLYDVPKMICDAYATPESKTARFFFVYTGRYMKAGAYSDKGEMHFVSSSNPVTLQVYGKMVYDGIVDNHIDVEFYSEGSSGDKIFIRCRWDDPKHNC